MVMSKRARRVLLAAVTIYTFMDLVCWWVLRELFAEAKDWRPSLT